MRSVVFCSLLAWAVLGISVAEAGDLAAGFADPLPDSNVRLALVRPVDATFDGVMGVVEGRMALRSKPQHQDEQDQEPTLELHSAEGPALPGDYVALTVLGVAQVKVDEGAAIQPGQRLTASDVPGQARALRTVEVEGVKLAESAPVIGIGMSTRPSVRTWLPGCRITLQAST